jgi:hypothetical protein
MNAVIRNPESLANLFLIGGAVIFSIFPELSGKWWLFMFFLTGHVTWSIHGLKRQNRDLVILNMGMLLLDVYAIAIRLT